MNQKYQRENDIKALLESGLKHTYIAFDTGNGKCPLCGEPLIFISMDIPGPCHDFTPIVGHHGENLCVGSWIHNKELMEHHGMLEHYKPLPCLDPACDSAWQEINI